MLYDLLTKASNREGRSLLTKCVPVYNKYHAGDGASVPLWEGWLMPCLGPVHNILKQETAWICVRHGWSSLPSIGWLHTNFKTTPMFVLFCS